MPKQSPPRTERAPWVSVPALRARGWTEALIRKHLGPPDQTAPNPHYRTGPPMRLYLLARVEACEATPAFVVGAAQAATRRARAVEAADRKRAAVLAWVERLTIAVPRLTEAVLVERACRHYNRAAHVPDWVLDRQEQQGGRVAATPASDPSFLVRITVNYLRHQMTHYDRLLTRTFGQVGAAQARLAIAEKVYEAIAAQYPHLADECARQYDARVEQEDFR